MEASKNERTTNSSAVGFHGNFSGEDPKCPDSPGACIPVPRATAHLVSIMAFLFVLIIVVNGGIIWYERAAADIYRTLVNSAVAVMSAYNICLSTWMIVLLLLRASVTKKF